MATKRLRDGSDGDSDQSSSEDKRMRISVDPSFSTVTRETVAIKTFQNLLVALEPMLRKVVHEEVDRGLVQGVRSLQRSPPQKQVQVMETSNLQLVFSKRLSLPIFTGTKIQDEDSNSLCICLFKDDNYGGGSRSSVAASLPSSIKVEIVVIDGDFPCGEHEEYWTSDEFERNIVKERTGKRPLLTGDVNLTLRDGAISTIGELAFTDNSSWIRSRKFRLGARVSPGSCEGLTIREAMTEPFVVKDHRGELYKKHHPPSLQDAVWRLEKIGKDGAFHKKLATEHIHTVQDFLKLWVVDPGRLRTILGMGMSDRVWEATIDHARTCVLGGKLYLHRAPGAAIVLNPICQLQGTMLNGLPHAPNDLHAQQRAYVQQLVLEAYKQWDQLEEVDEMLSRTTLHMQSDALTPQVAMGPTHQDTEISSYQGGGFDGGEVVEALPENVQVEFGGWIQNPSYLTATIHRRRGRVYNAPDFSSSEDDTESNPSQVYFS